MCLNVSKMMFRYIIARTELHLSWNLSGNCKLLGIHFDLKGQNSYTFYRENQRV